MKKRTTENKLNTKIVANKKEENVAGYPLYPESEDLYSMDLEESEIDPENISKTKLPNEEAGSMNEKDFKDDFTGEDLDIPGNEKDEEEENMGSEDEENNYYSLGGDGHNSLEEDNG